MFELIQLRCFVAVAEELHFGRAAARLNMSQPPISRHIQVLERILGVQLFIRSSRSVSLTASGKSFLSEAKRLVTLSENAYTSARAAAAGERGTLRIGFTAASLYSFAPKVIETVEREIPGVELHLQELVTRDQLEQLSSGKLDFAILRPPVDQQEFNSRLVVKERFLVCSPTSIAEADRPRTLADFNGQPVVMYAPNKAQYFHDLVAGLFATEAVYPRIAHYLVHIHSIMILVAEGRGFAIVPESASKLRPVGVEFAPLEGVGEIVELYAAWRRADTNPAAARLVESIARA